MHCVACGALTRVRNECWDSCIAEWLGVFVFISANALLNDQVSSAFQKEKIFVAPIYSSNFLIKLY